MSPFDVTGMVIKVTSVISVVLTALFIVLRIMGVVHWAWWWLISPVVIYMVALIIFFVLMCYAMAKGGM